MSTAIDKLIEQIRAEEREKARKELLTPEAEQLAALTAEVAALREDVARRTFWQPLPYPVYPQPVWQVPVVQPVVIPSAPLSPHPWWQQPIVTITSDSQPITTTYALSDSSAPAQ